MDPDNDTTAPDEEIGLPPLDGPDNEPSEEPAARPIGKQDEAFLMSQAGARQLSFGGRNGGPVDLEEFDTHRHVAAQKMGMEFFNMGETAFEEFRERETYDGIFLDAVLVVYLCVMSRNTALRALRSPTHVRNQALQWAEDNRVRIGSAQHGELLEAFGEILNDIINSVAEVDETGTTSTGESLGE